MPTGELRIPFWNWKFRKSYFSRHYEQISFSRHISILGGGQPSFRQLRWDHNCQFAILRGLDHGSLVSYVVRQEILYVVPK